MDKNRIHIAVLEPYAIVYEGISNILLSLEPRFIIFQFENCDDLFSAISQKSFDLVLMNPSMVQNRMKEIQAVRKNCKNTRWVSLVYAFYEEEFLAQFDARINISDPAPVIHERMNHLLSSRIEKKFFPPQEHLTERETDVLIQLVHGLSNKEIADKLNISIHTVVSHRKNISQKTGIKSQSGLTIFAISNKIVSLSSLSI